MHVANFENPTANAALPFGLTGGVACGKSTVARDLEQLGARIIDADRIGHEVIEPGCPAHDEIVAHFGKTIVDANGAINRKVLGPIVFADREQLRALNQIVHPRIIARVNELVREYHAQNPKAVVIVDAALIFESGIGGAMRKVIVAWCRPEQQLERLIAKMGGAREEAERRIRAQMPPDEKLRRADYVIDCSGTLEETRLQAEKLFPTLVGEN